MLPTGCKIVKTFEDIDLNRTFIVKMPDGNFQYWVRCGQNGVWLVEAEDCDGNSE